MYTTEKVPKQYKVIDKNNNNVIFILDSLEGAYDKVNAYTIKTYGEGFRMLLEDNAKSILINIKTIVGYKPDYDANLNELGQPPLRDIVETKHLYGIYVIDECGDIVKKDLLQYRYKRYNRDKYVESDKIRNKILNGLLERKNNTNKIKFSYLTHVSSYGDLELKVRYRRPAKLFQLVKQLDNFIKDENEPKVRGTIKNIPNLWDGSRNNNGHNFRSWKRNSRRRKQWKVKSNDKL